MTGDNSKTKGRNRRPFYFPQPGFTALLVVVAGLACASCAAAQAGRNQQPERRIAPPAGVQCDRNQLTSYSGTVSGYRLEGNQLWLQISTEWDTVEQVKIDGVARHEAVAHFLWQGEPFGAADWALLEESPGVLRQGLRVTAWVCLDEVTPPLFNWVPQQD